MDRERIERARMALAGAGLDALICRLPENVLLLSGYWPLTGRSFLLFPREGKPVCFVPAIHEKEAIAELWEADCKSIPFGRLDSGDYFGQLEKELKAAISGRGFKRIGFEGSFETFAAPWGVAEPAIPAAPSAKLLLAAVGTAELVDATDLLYGLRATKTQAEMVKLRIANEIGAMGLRAFAEAVREGASGFRLASLVESVIMNEGTGYKGARRVRGFAQVSTGEAETMDGYRMLLVSTERKLASGDIAMLELAVVADGFWCDRTRVRVAGKPSPRQISAFEAVMKAQTAAIGAIRSGVIAESVDTAARNVIDKAGFGKGFFHVTGHGLGFRYHEPIPIIAPGVMTVLEAGMVITIEPGIYLPGVGGIRMEDDFLVTDTGAESLGEADSKLFS